MKILFVINNIKQCGPYRVLESIINSMGRHDLAVISLFGQDDERLVNQLKDKDVFVYNLSLSKKNLFFKGEKSLKNIVNEFKPHVIHSHGILPDYLVSKIKSVKTISTLHNNMYEDYYYSFGKIKSKFIIKWHKHIYKRFDKVICCSKSIYDYMTKKSTNINYSYIRNGIDQIYISNKERIRETIRKELRVSTSDIVFIYTGVISSRKRVCELVKLFMKLDGNYKLIILGNGPLYDTCYDICKDRENIIMLGYKKDVMPYLLASDVYISNSASEGLSISVLEALMLGKTLFLSDIPSHIENINMLNSYCGENFNENNFYKKVKKLKINNNYSKNDYYELSSERMVKEYEKEYKSI